nr:protein-tyrosine-phosphatase [Saprospiraceae bacterium]
GVADENEMLLFSKRFAAEFNPQNNFIAVMVCGEADRACPIVPGAFARVSLPYEDPKAADNTPAEGRSYDDKVREIGREILFMVKCLKDREAF